jgi:ubiquinone/menaquinone biosynthesis C-methylase UbiE
MTQHRVIAEKEKVFFDKFWAKTSVEIIKGVITIPNVKSLKNAKILICSCGSGVEPVQAANDGAIVFAFDISPIAVENAKTMAKANNVNLIADVMDFHRLKYPDNYFDYLYGSYILHHVDCRLAGKEIFRCLKPNGIAYFVENSDRNPILRFIRKTLFGAPGETRRQKFLIFKRLGTSDERCITESDLIQLSDIFSGNLSIVYTEFVFFRMLPHVLHDIPGLGKVTSFLDMIIGRMFPAIMKYSFAQGILLKKPS